VELAAVRKCPDYGCRRMPVFGSRVSVVDDSMTGPGGRVDFLGLPRGRYAVCALAYYAAAPTGSSPTGYADKCTGPTFTLDASPGVVSTATIHLDPGGVLTGRVTDGQGHGVPLAAIHFPGTPVDDVPGGVDDFNNATFLQPSPFDDNYTDLHGRYTIRSIRAGQGTLCAHARRYVKGCLSNPLTITAGANTQAPPLALTPRAQAAAEALPRTRTTSGVPTRRVIVVDGRMVPAGRSPRIRVPSRR
jgi:hypothetical protein